MLAWLKFSVRATHLISYFLTHVKIISSSSVASIVHIDDNSIVDNITDIFCDVANKNPMIADKSKFPHLTHFRVDCNAGLVTCNCCNFTGFVGGVQCVDS